MSINTEQEFVRWEGASRDTIDVKRIYIDICGDLAGGVWFSQMLYYFLPMKGEDGNFRRNFKLVWKQRSPDEPFHWWLPMSREGWWDQCRIKIKQYDRCVGIWQDELKAVEVWNTMHGYKKTPHIRVDWAVFIQLLNDHGASYDLSESEKERGKTNNPEMGESVSPSASKIPNRENRLGQNGITGQVESSLPVRSNGPEHKDKDVFKDIVGDQQHQQAAPVADDGVEIISSKKGKKRTRHIMPSVDSLEEPRRSAAISLMECDVAPGTAVELAGNEGLPLEVILKQVEWLPGAIQDVLDNGKEVPNPAGLLVWRIRNLAPKPKAFERLERERETSEAEAARVAKAAAETAEADALWNELSNAQRRALDDYVLEKFRREYDNPMLKTTSSGFAKRRGVQLRDPETREWLAKLDQETAPAEVAEPIAVAPKKQTEKAPGFEPATERLGFLGRLVTELRFDIEEGLVAVGNIAANLAENAALDDNERDWIARQFAPQRTNYQRKVA